MKLTPKQKLTIFSISESMAHTTKWEIEIISVLDTPEPRLRYVNGPLDGYRYGSFKRRGKRTVFHLDIRLGDLVFEGWDLPIVTDHEVKHGSFSGNACFNLGLDLSRIGGTSFSESRLEAIFVRAFLEDKNLNLPLTDATKGKCILVRESDGVCGDGELLYPEIEVAHAVIDRMKEKLAAA